MNESMKYEMAIAAARQEAQKTPKRVVPVDVFVNLYSDADCEYVSTHTRRLLKNVLSDIDSTNKYSPSYTYLGTIVTRPSGETFMADFSIQARELASQTNRHNDCSIDNALNNPYYTISNEG